MKGYAILLPAKLYSGIGFARPTCKPGLDKLDYLRSERANTWKHANKRL
jgi:hypothetical protein